MANTAGPCKASERLYAAFAVPAGQTCPRPGGATPHAASAVSRVARPFAAKTSRAIGEPCAVTQQGTHAKKKDRRGGAFLFFVLQQQGFGIGYATRVSV